MLCFVEIAQGCRKPANNVVFILLPINCWQRSVGQISMTNFVNFFCFDCVKTLFCFGKLIFTEQIWCLLSPDLSLVTAVTFTVAWCVVKCLQTFLVFRKKYHLWDKAWSGSGKFGLKNLWQFCYQQSPFSLCYQVHFA